MTTLFGDTAQIYIDLQYDRESSYKKHNFEKTTLKPQFDTLYAWISRVTGKNRTNLQHKKAGIYKKAVLCIYQLKPKTMDTRTALFTDTAQLRIDLQHNITSSYGKGKNKHVHEYSLSKSLNIQSYTTSYIVLKHTFKYETVKSRH